MAIPARLRIPVLWGCGLYTPAAVLTPHGYNARMEVDFAAGPALGRKVIA